MFTLSITGCKTGRCNLNKTAYDRLVKWQLRSPKTSGLLGIFMTERTIKKMAEESLLIIKENPPKNQTTLNTSLVAVGSTGTFSLWENDVHEIQKVVS